MIQYCRSIKKHHEACFSLRKNCVEEWWPLPSQDSNSSVPKPRQVGLFLRGQIRRRAAGRASAKAKAKSKSKEKAGKEKKTKTKGKKLKTAKPEIEIEREAKNFRRNGVGVQLVEQLMRKAKHLDDVKFKSNTIFSESSQECRLKLPICQEKKWEDVCKAAHPYFKAMHVSATPKRWSELVSKQFDAVFEGLESETPDRKKWMQLIRDICQFLHDLSPKKEAA
eukprot:s3146_g6.t1